MGALLAGVAIGLFLAFLGWYRRKTVGAAKRGKDGWRSLRPRWVIRALIAALVLLIGFAIASNYWAGTAHAVSGPQYKTAAIISAITLSVAAFILWPLWSRTVRWNDTEVRMRTIWGRESGGRFDDVGLVRYHKNKGRYTVVFLSGERVEFSEEMHGSQELLDRLPRNAVPG